jgi:transposase
MSRITTELKHHVLTQCQPGSRTNGFHALAVKYNIKGGHKSVENWWNRWDGTPQSLERNAGSGRPKALTRSQVFHEIVTPIRAKNRKNESIHYPTFKDDVEKKIGHNIGLRTVQRYGKETGGITFKTTKKRTAQERKNQKK